MQTHPDRRTAALVLTAIACTLPTAALRGQAPQADPLAAVVRGHAAHCCDLYRATETRVKALQGCVAELVSRPTAASLRSAREAWVEARRVYCQTEALRFGGGPIDAIEGYLNAWPVDEAYLDATVGQPNGGIVNDLVHFPNLGATVLLHANERGGETNISVGWHAIEFFLWGQDRDPAGPGNRPHTDYVDGTGINARRRAQYLQAITDLLVQQLGTLSAAWAPDADNFRRRFEADPKAALRAMLTGASILTAFELGGERLAVAYETKDQEQEHCCFSDTTLADLAADQLGIQSLFTGERDGVRFGPGLLALLRRDHAAISSDLERKLAATLAALRAIPQPFDQAILGNDDAPGRTAIRAALAAIDAQTDAIAIAGHALGFDPPLRPGR